MGYIYEMKLTSLVVVCGLMGCTIAVSDDRQPPQQDFPSAGGGSNDQFGGWGNECQFVASQTASGYVICGGQDNPGDPYEAKKERVVDPYEHNELRGEQHTTIEVR